MSRQGGIKPRKKDGSAEMRRGAEVIFRAMSNKSVALFAEHREDDSRAVTLVLQGLRRWIERDGLLEVERLVMPMAAEAKK